MGASIQWIWGIASRLPRSPCMRSILAPPSIFSARGRLISTLPPYGRVGIARAIGATPQTKPTPITLANEFSLADRVALVTGANSGIGLEMALALVEAGARSVYCLDLPREPGEQWTKVTEYIKKLERPGGPMGKLEYISGNVTDQEAMWKIGKTIGDREGRMDVCVASAGIIGMETPCLTYPEKQFKEESECGLTVHDVNVNGVLYTAQAAGQQMERFGKGGSIVMIASVAGHRCLPKDQMFVSYCTSKAAVIQLARCMACELGPQNIRVNSISPAYIQTQMTSQVTDRRQDFADGWIEQQIIKRSGLSEEVRGVAVWLASDASSFCTGSDYPVNGGYLAR